MAIIKGNFLFLIEIHSVPSSPLESMRRLNILNQSNNNNISKRIDLYTPSEQWKENNLFSNMSNTLNITSGSSSAVKMLNTAK